MSPSTKQRPRAEKCAWEGTGEREDARITSYESHQDASAFVETDNTHHGDLCPRQELLDSLFPLLSLERVHAR
jgi:hypothetical protein